MPVTNAEASRIEAHHAGNPDVAALLDTRRVLLDALTTTHLGGDLGARVGNCEVCQLLREIHDEVRQG